MSVESHMIHTCTTQRAVVTVDDLNQSTSSWGDWLSELICRLVIKDQRNPFSALAGDPVTTTHLLLVPADSDIVAGDQIIDIEFEDGTTDAGPFRIEAIRPRRGRAARHMSLSLERV